MDACVLIIDDDTELTAMLAAYLGTRGFVVTTRSSAKEGLQALNEGGVDALILDVMLPDGDGLEICTKLRSVSRIPILMLTARGEDTDRIIGLELGADDYLPKPFNPRELVARLRAVLRRADDHRLPDAQIHRFGSLRIDESSRRVFLAGDECELTTYQFDILLALANNSGRVLTRDALMNHLRGQDFEAFDRSIDVHISRIRAAIEDDARHPRRILTIRGVGYVFAQRQD